MLLLNLIFFVVIALLSACAWDMYSLAFFRFLIGFGIGADYPICAAYLAEMIPKHRSNKLLASVMFVNCMAPCIGIVVAYLMLKFYHDINVWRLMYASGAVPAIIGLLLRVNLPESFVWKAHQRMKAEKKQVVSMYRQFAAPKIMKMTFLLSICWFLQDVCSYGIGLFTPYLLNSLHLSSADNFLNSQYGILMNTLIINAFVVLGAFSSIFIIDKMDSVKLQKIGFAYAGLGLVIFSLSYFFSSAISSTMIFLGFMLFNFFITLGPGTTTYVLPAQYYSTEIRATGHGIASSTGKFGAFLGTLLLPTLNASFGIHMTMAILSISLLLGWLFSNMLINCEMTYESDLLQDKSPAYSLSAS